jgi:RNA polymerase sigma-70 factor (ECF subfamily)
VNEFGCNVERHRRELLVHCYRMVGSLPDAEDAVQETSVLGNV